MDRYDRGGFMTGKTRWIAAALGAVLWLGGTALAADDAKVAELEKQLKALQEQVAAMKGADTAELERKIDVLAKEIEAIKLGEVSDRGSQNRYGLGPSASKVYGIKKGVSIGGYGEALYSNPSASLGTGRPPAPTRPWTCFASCSTSARSSTTRSSSTPRSSTST
jgi:hypothetical protein